VSPPKVRLWSFAIIRDRGNTVRPNHVILELAHTQGWRQVTRTGVTSRVECSEFMSRFSDFYDAPPQSPLRRQAEVHLEGCEKCARYGRAVASGAALLKTLPRVELSESFRPTLEHRLFHLEDENTLARATGASAVPVLTAVGLAVVIAIVAWAPKFTRASVQVDLAPGVSSPLSGEPALILDPGIFPVQEPVLDLQKGLWSDPNALLFEYSSMRERYRTRDLIRQTESEF